MLLVMLIAGCSETTAGTPTTTPVSATTASSSAGSTQGVAQPLNPTAYLSKPCDLVPQQLLTTLGYANPGTPKTTGAVGGPSCNWIFPASSKLIHVQVGQLASGKRDGGIANVYKTRDAGGFTFAEPTEVAGYPAAYADTNDNRANGTCMLFVGIADDLTFSATADGYQGRQDSCTTAQQIAAAVLETLEG